MGVFRRFSWCIYTRLVATELNANANIGNPTRACMKWRRHKSFFIVEPHWRLVILLSSQRFSVSTVVWYDFDAETFKWNTVIEFIYSTTRRWGSYEILGEYTKVDSLARDKNYMQSIGRFITMRRQHQQQQRNRKIKLHCAKS